MKPTVKKEIVRHSLQGLRTVPDTVAVEMRLKVLVNSKEALNLYCTPMMIRELVVGLMMTEGVIEGGFCTDQMSIEYLDDQVRVDIPAEGRVRTEGGTVTSGCVGGITFQTKDAEPLPKGAFTVEGHMLHDIFKMFNEKSELYRETGCMHAAALSDGQRILIFAEDIGRHNAIDKVVGSALLDNIDLSDKVLMASGRLSSEMVTKAARWKIPVCASRSAPTSLAVELAQKAGLTLVGFVRSRGFNIYAGQERIVRPD